MLGPVPSAALKPMEILDFLSPLSLLLNTSTVPLPPGT